MLAPVPGGRVAEGWSRFSMMTDAARAQAIAACREVSESIYPGLDLTDEISATRSWSKGPKEVGGDMNVIHLAREWMACKERNKLANWCRAYVSS
jgi:hypothetical protein